MLDRRQPVPALWSVSETAPLPSHPSHPIRWQRRYHQLQPLADGGMAQVYRAYDTHLKQQVALKVLPAAFGDDPVMRERFRLETLRLQALQHPHIVPVLDYGVYQERLFFSMPFYPTNLRQQLRQYGAPPLGVTVHLIEQLAAALDCAHSHGFIHRDIKPNNILLDQAGEVYLADFGISKSLPRADHRLKTGRLIREMEYEEEHHQLLFATPDYCAPEHLMGRPVDARTDVFGLGLVLYELLTGRQPYCHADDPGPTQLSREQYANLLFDRIQNERPLPPSQLASLSTRLMAKNVDATVLRALDPHPKQRYGSAGELAAALSASLAVK